MSNEKELGKITLSDDDENEIDIINDDDDDEMNDLEDDSHMVTNKGRKAPPRSRSGRRQTPNHSMSGSSRFRRTATAEKVDRRGMNDSFSTGSNLWKSRADDDNVDQSLNLMDQKSDAYDASAVVDVSTARPARPRARPGMLNTRQRSLVDIFLADDRHPQSRGSKNDYGVTDLSSQNRSRKCRCLLLSVGAILVLTALFVAVPQFGLFPVFYGNDKDSNNNAPAPSPAQNNNQEQEVEEAEGETTLSENVRPIAAGESLANGNSQIDVEDVPKSDRFDALKFYVVDLDVTEQEQLDKPDSPASKALLWLSQKDPAEMEIPGLDAVATTNDLAEHALLQRYALAVFYYTMQDSSSNQEDNSVRRFLADDKPSSEELANRESFDNEWLSADHICFWHGVTCDDDFESVTTLELPNHLLQGTIPREILVGGSMPFLEKIILMSNQLQGTFPRVTQERASSGSELGVNPPVSAVKELQLSNNLLTGYLDNIMDMQDLEVIDLSLNQFKGPLPDEVVNLTKLQELKLGTNQMSGNLPADSLGELTSLRILEVDHNSFSEGLPMTLYTLTNLRTLTLSFNEFTGEIPDSYGDIINLRQLDLDENDLKGSLPTQLGKLKELERFMLSGNNFSGTVAPEICDLRGSTLRQFVVDCRGITCSCCTECF